MSGLSFTLRSEQRDALLAALNVAGVPTAIHYPVPLHRQPAYEHICRIEGNLANAERLASQVFSLPMHPYMSLDTQKAIVGAIVGIAGHE